MPVTLHDRNNDQLTDTEVSAWQQVPVAIAVDLEPDSQLDLLIRPINPPGSQPRLLGRAFTVQCEPPDFGAVLHALDHVRRNDVLVIAASGYSENAMIGEILSGHVRKQGCTGIVCDGAIRDVATLAAWSDFSVFTRHINPRGPTGSDKGQVLTSVRIGKVTVNPGDLILGDDDGLVALSKEAAKRRIQDAIGRIEQENGWVDGLADGQSATSVFGLSDPIKPVN